MADEIKIPELIASGHLVRLKTFVKDVGAFNQMNPNNYGDLTKVESESVPVNKAVVYYWKEHAYGRQTVVFCSTIAHAEAVRFAFKNEGINAVTIDGKMNRKERKEILELYNSKEAMVIINVAVLTDGWDHPATSCVIILRLISYKCTMIQMIGRGLRISPNKIDCIVLDFGLSTTIHKSLEEEVNLYGVEKTESEEGLFPEKSPESISVAPDYGLESHQFKMKEIEMMKTVSVDSNFLWADLNCLDIFHHRFGIKSCSVARGYTAWAGLFETAHCWVALGGTYERANTVLSLSLMTGDKWSCIDAVNQFMKDKRYYIDRHWMHQPVTQDQQKYTYIKNLKGLTKYDASLVITVKEARVELKVMKESEEYQKRELAKRREDFQGREIKNYQD